MSVIRNLLFLCIMLLSACATTTKIDQKDVQNIQFVKVLFDDIDLQIAYSGPGQAWAMGLGGAIGGAISGSGYTKEAAAIYSFLEDNDIDLKTLIVKDLKTKISQNTDFEVLDDNADTADATFIIFEYGLGFHTSSPLNKNVRPTIGYQIRMLKPDGIELWKGRGFSGVYSVSVDKGKNLREWMDDSTFTASKINEAIDFAGNIFITMYKKATE